METTSRQLRGLLKKNLLIRKRNVGTTICEILFPIVLMLLITIIKIGFPLNVLTNIMSEKEFLETNSTFLMFDKPDDLSTKYGLNTERTL